MAEFSLADALAVSQSDTGDREQIEYIKLDLLQSDERNFYSLDGIEELARNIETVGLQQPIRVRKDPDNPGHYIVVSGHRRKAALQLLEQEGNSPWLALGVPCIVERSQGSDALEELRLIYANNDTRKMSPADISKQAQKVERLLYRLKEEGHEFPGKMREHVAQVCKVNATKLARLKVIKDGLVCKEAVKAFDKGTLSEDAAYELAKATPEAQHLLWATTNGGKYAAAHGIKARREGLDKISKAKAVPELCGSGSCSNIDGRTQERMTTGPYDTECEDCCIKCSKLTKCPHACPHLADQIKEKKQADKEAKAKEREKRAAKDKPTVDKIRALWQRAGEARKQAGMTPEQWLELTGKGYLLKYNNAEQEINRMLKRESDADKFKPETSLPEGYPNLYYIEHLIALADRLGCSLDYLLCRTDEPVPAAPAVCDPARAVERPMWYPGEQRPKDSGIYLCKVDVDGAIIVCNLEWDRFDVMWRHPSDFSEAPYPVIGWYPIPQKEDPDEGDGEDEEDTDFEV